MESHDPSTQPNEPGQAPPLAGNLVAGTRWNFQFVYRDSAAGGAMFNASDAIAIDFVP